MGFAGYKHRSRDSCRKRLVNHLSGMNKSKMTLDEERIITECHLKGLSFAEMAEKMHNRSYVWVFHQ